MGRRVTATLSLTFPTGAIEVLPADVSRAEWLGERRTSIGGSDASTLVGLNPYSSRMALWLDKTGQLPEQRATSAMEWGNLLEPVVRDWLAATYDLDIRRVGMLRRTDAPRVHGNLDGVVVDADGTPIEAVEIKTSSHRLAYQWADGQCPDHAELQAQLCMWVTGLPRCWVVGLIDGRDPKVRMVHADPVLGQMLADAAADFYADHVDPGLAPALDESEATNDALRAALGHDSGRKVELSATLRELALDYIDAQGRVRDAEGAARLAHTALLAALGDAAEICDDPSLPDDERTVYLTAVNNGTFSSKRFTQAHPEIAEEFTVDTPQLDAAALKTAHPDLHRAHRARVIRTRKPLADLLSAAIEES